MSTRGVLLQEGLYDQPKETGGLAVLEEWFVLLLGTISAGLVGAIVGSYATGTDPAILASLATAGYLLGYLFARMRAPDLFAHAVTLWLGILVALFAIDPEVLWHEVSSGAWRTTLERYDALLRSFLSSFESGSAFQSDVTEFALGLAMGLVGYTAAWMLFRRGWIFWSIAVPGAMLLATLALERERPSWPALVYLGLVLAVAAGHTAIERSFAWQSRAMAQPPGIGHRSILLGSLIASLAIAAGLYYSFDLDDRFQERALSGGDRLADWISDRFDETESGRTGPQPTSGNYGAFSDQFRVGDGVPTGDVPIVVMQSDGEKYLVARRMNEYDGSGWKSTAGVSAEASAPAPRISFQSDQPMNLPREQIQHHVQEEASIVVLQPGDRLMFTIGQHFSASIPTLVRVGWQEIDTFYQIGETDLGQVPADLRELIALLQMADFDGSPSTGMPQFVAEMDQIVFDRIQSHLLENYPVAVELGWDDTGQVLAHVTGRLPVYSDVEAVFSSDDVVDSSYSVVGLAPRVAAEELAASSTSYPQYIVDTYLGLPVSVTPQTQELANQIVTQAGARTPYDVAMAIQNYLRANFTYQIDAGPAPDGRDIVDYFLFESKVGRCDHYASSMAVMLRSLGIPARIVTGLAPVPYDTDMNGYVYRGRNAHAWVEVYFPGYGWIMFEPTPTQQPFDLEQGGADPILTPEPTPTTTPVSLPEATQSSIAPTPTATPLPAPATADIQPPPNRGDGLSPLAIGSIAGGTLLLFGGGLYYWQRRRMFSGLPVASANFSRLQRLGRLFGVAPAPELTPYEYASQFGAVRPQSASGAMRVADAYAKSQYATNTDVVLISHESDEGWREAKAGATDWRFWRR